MTVQEEKERLLAESLQRAEEELFQDGKETLTKREVLAILEGTYSSLLDKEYEKYRQGSFICASGNFDRYVQYCKDTSGTLAIEYAKVIHTIASKSVEEDKALLNRAKQGLRQAKKELQELKEGIKDTKIVS